MELVEAWGLDFSERLDALRAQILRNGDAVFHDVHTLDIRLELAAGMPHREAAGIAKLGLLPAIFTDCHQLASTE